MSEKEKIRLLVVKRACLSEKRKVKSEKSNTLVDYYLELKELEMTCGYYLLTCIWIFHFSFFI